MLRAEKIDFIVISAAESHLMLRSCDPGSLIQTGRYGVFVLLERQGTRLRADDCTILQDEVYGTP